MLLLITKSGKKPEVRLFTSEEDAQQFIVRHISDTIDECALPGADSLLMLKTIARVMKRGLTSSGLGQISRACYNTGYRYTLETEDSVHVTLYPRDLAAEATKKIESRDKFGLRNLERHDLFEMISEIHQIVSGGEYDSDTGQQVADVFRIRDIEVEDSGEEGAL